MTLYRLEDILDGCENQPLAEVLLRRIAALHAEREKYRSALAEIAALACEYLAAEPSGGVSEILATAQDALRERQCSGRVREALAGEEDFPP